MKYFLSLFAGIIIGYAWSYGAYSKHFANTKNCLEILNNNGMYKIEVDLILYENILKNINKGDVYLFGYNDKLYKIRRIK